MDWESLIFPSVTTFGGFWKAACAWALIFIGMWVIFFVGFFCAGLEEFGGEARKSWALKLSMLVHHAVVGPLALIAIFEDSGIIEALQCLGCAGAGALLVQDGDIPKSVEALMPITIGYMVADLALLPAWSLTKGSMLENALMILHHGFSLIVWPFTFFYNYCTRYVLILLSYEVSSIFLTMNWLLKSSGKKQSPLYKVSGLLFTGSFVVLRMIGSLPQLRALWLVPPWTNDVASVVLGSNKMASWQTAFTITIVIPHLLNWFWGFKVIRGFLQVARRGDRNAHARVVPLLENE